MTGDYTMDDFRAEMQRRNVPASAAEPSTITPQGEKTHGSTIIEIVPCSVHPLHMVKVRASGARSGCPMCETQIDDICRSMTRSPSSPRDEGPEPQDHRPVIARDTPEGPWMRIVGCTCGWRTPPGTPDSEETFVVHIAINRAGGGRQVSAFNGVKVFAATMVQQRQSLGDQVTAWIETAHRQIPGFQLVDVIVSQSSDEAFHCISCCLFYKETLVLANGAKEKKRRG